VMISEPAATMMAIIARVSGLMVSIAPRALLPA
jgi:hypothetical protein